MSAGTETVRKYMEAFGRSDHAGVLSCLTDDVVVAEGGVQAARRDGGRLNAVFCDVFEMRGALIRRLTSYVMELKS